jgi:predicted nucleic acid-binding protein
MTTYVDTNALVRFYIPRHKQDLADLPNLLTDSNPIPVPQLLRMETLNAFERLVFEWKNGGSWRVTPEIAAIAKAQFDEDLAEESFLKRTTVPLHELEMVFEKLVSKHSAKYGFRTYEILHVASALILGCKHFLSFDVKAKSLAKVEGLYLTA